MICEVSVSINNSSPLNQSTSKSATNHGLFVNLAEIAEKFFSIKTILFLSMEMLRNVLRLPMVCYFRPNYFLIRQDPHPRY